MRPRRTSGLSSSPRRRSSPSSSRDRQALAGVVFRTASRGGGAKVQHLPVQRQRVWRLILDPQRLVVSAGSAGISEGNDSLEITVAVERTEMLDYLARTLEVLP